MAYLYVQTKALPYGVNRNWITYVDSNQLVNDLLNPYLYRMVFIDVKEDELSESFGIDLSTLANIVIGQEETIEQFLQRDDLPILTPSDDYPDTDIFYIEYRNPNQYGYTLGVSNFNEEPSQITPLDELNDLIMTRPSINTDLHLLHTNSLLTVNGYLHQTLIDEEEHGVIYIKDGGKTRNISKTAHVGILSFENIGNIKKYNFNELSVTPEIDNNPLYGIITIDNIPDSLDSNSFILSLGGYIILPKESVLWKDGTNRIKLDITKIDYVDKLIYSSKWLDLSTLNLSSIITDPENTDISVLQNDDVILSYLNLSQSFLITIPLSKQINYDNIFKPFSNDNKVITSYPTISLLFNDKGQILNYWSKNVYERSRYIYTTTIVMELNDYPEHVDIFVSEDYNLLLQAFPDKANDKSFMINSIKSIGFYS